MLDENNFFNRPEAELRAAEYYRLLRSNSENWASIGDLEPQLCPFAEMILTFLNFRPISYKVLGSGSTV